MNAKRCMAVAVLASVGLAPSCETNPAKLRTSINSLLVLDHTDKDSWFYLTPEKGRTITQAIVGSDQDNSRLDALAISACALWLQHDSESGTLVYAVPLGLVTVERYSSWDVTSSNLNTLKHEQAIVQIAINAAAQTVKVTTTDVLSINLASVGDRRDFDDALSALIRACR